MVGNGSSTSARSNIIEVDSDELWVGGDINYTGTLSDISDRRLKENITPLNTVLNEVIKLNPVTFYMKESEKITKNISYGFIAQELETILPTFVVELDNGYKAIKQEFSAILVKAIQELDQKVTSQNLKIQQLETKIQLLEQDRTLKASQMQDLLDRVSNLESL